LNRLGLVHIFFDRCKCSLGFLHFVIALIFYFLLANIGEEAWIEGEEAWFAWDVGILQFRILLRLVVLTSTPHSRTPGDRRISIER
jgi:hypothetical protein